MSIIHRTPTFYRVLRGLALVAGLVLSPGALAGPPSGGRLDTGSVASSIDLRPAFEIWGLGPRVQGGRKTCSVITVAGAMEYAPASKTHRGTRLSAEFLNWASNQALGTMDDGSFFSDLWKGFTSHSGWVGELNCLTLRIYYDDDNEPGVEVLRLLKLPPEAKRTERTHHEAHFIRLGVGRALYAYRLAFGTLPDSLETLVEKGFMSARYLRDENNLPLKWRRDGDAMVVESPGKDHWGHSWKGLDPRR